MTWSFHPYTLPLSRPYSWAKGIQTQRRGLLVAHTVEGVTGWGEVAPPPNLDVDPVEIATYARKTMRVVMAQEDVPAALDAAGCGPRLRAGLAGAWLDAQARLQGLPLAQFLARRLREDPVREPAQRIPVNALVTAQEPLACARDAQLAVASGYTTLKLKSDGNAVRDVARLQAVREAVGAKVALRLDANESYHPAEAQVILESLAPFNLEYVEQPVPAAHRDAIARLLQDSPVPIALDESASSWLAVSAFSSLKPILILKPQRLGGADRTATFLAKAQDAGLRCVVTNSLETAVGRAHALHTAALLAQPLPACGLATEAYLAQVVAELRSSSGWMTLPEGPGIGLDARVEAPHATRLE